MPPILSLAWRKAKKKEITGRRLAHGGLRTFVSANKDARAGKISAFEYATKLMRIESKGIIAQVSVALDLGLKQSNAPWIVDIVQNYRDGKITEKEMEDQVFNEAKENARISDGRKVWGTYIDMFRRIPKVQGNGGSNGGGNSEGEGDNKGGSNGGGGKGKSSKTSKSSGGSSYKEWDGGL